MTNGRAKLPPSPRLRRDRPSSKHQRNSKHQTSNCAAFRYAASRVILVISATMIYDHLRRYSMIFDEFGPEKIKKVRCRTGNPPPLRFGATGQPHWVSWRQEVHGGTSVRPPAARATRSGRYNPAEVARAWGWQNEAKTKPKGDAVGAVYGLAGFVERPYLQDKAAFRPDLRRRVRSGGKLQNEATDTGRLSSGGKAGRSTESWNLKFEKRPMKTKKLSQIKPNKTPDILATDETQILLAAMAVVIGESGAEATALQKLRVRHAQLAIAGSRLTMNTRGTGVQPPPPAFRRGYDAGSSVPKVPA
jgi:hypothetical protein